ncbi:retropepsin-like aspartic protease [Brevundimonas sp.]|uniref:retropepsin-like aspartic protease n=1 Tax=Brevundimonas sp. TaxID=1871086 RepID=UPI0025CB8D98|nr:retropepsin-like aspartic protease [Brevundimonas sp.]
MASRRGFLGGLAWLGAGAAGAWLLRERVFWPTASLDAEAVGESGWLPFAEARTPLPLVNVGLNGVTVSALIDSGAQHSLVDRALAERLELTEALTPPMIAYGAGGGGQVGRGADMEIRLGETTLNRVRAASLELGPIADPDRGGVGVILGQDVLQVLVADIDFPKRRMRFEPRTTHQAPEGARDAAVWKRGRALEARVAMEGAVIDAVVDTGATAALSLTRSAAERAGLLDGRTERRSTSIVLGGAVEGVSVRAERLWFSGRTFEDQEVHILPDGRIPGFPDGLLGLGLLAHERVLLDLGGGALRMMESA